MTAVRHTYRGEYTDRVGSRGLRRRAMTEGRSGSRRSHGLGAPTGGVADERLANDARLTDSMAPMMLGTDSVNTASSPPLPETRTMYRTFCTAVMLALGTSVPLWAQATDSAPPSVQRPAPKINIWPARSVSIPADPKAKPIRIGIWDSGVDTTLFAGRLARDARGSVLLRGYDPFKQRQDTPMEVLPPALLARQDELNAATMALDDLDTFVSSPAARAVQAHGGDDAGRTQACRR